MVKELVEKPSLEEAPSNVVILGRYIIISKIFEILEDTVAEKEMKYSLQMHFLSLLKKRKCMHMISKEEDMI